MCQCASLAGGAWDATELQYRVTTELLPSHIARCLFGRLSEPSSSLTTISPLTKASGGMGGTTPSPLTKAPGGIGGTVPSSLRLEPDGTAGSVPWLPPAAARPATARRP